MHEFLAKNMIIIPPPLPLAPYFLFLPQLEMVLNGRKLNIIMIHAKFQGALAKFQTTGFRRHFKQWHKC
jgi:hypothetical protein